MSAVHNDFEQLRVFAERLQGYLDTIADANANLDNAFAELGEIWTDQKRTEFEEVYEQLCQTMMVFKENASQQIPYLCELANILEEYYNRRTSLQMQVNKFETND